MKKKLVTLLFVMCGLVIVLAGCGGKEKDVSKKDSSKEKQKLQRQQPVHLKQVIRH